MSVAAAPSYSLIKLPEEAFEDLAAIASSADELRCLTTNSVVLQESSELDSAILELVSAGKGDAHRLRRVSQALRALSALRQSLSCTATDLLHILSSSIEKHASPEWKASHVAGWNGVQPHLQVLLEPDGDFATLEKARVLGYSYSNPLTNAQIITDIRPVFDSEANEIKRVSVSFVLAIDHHEGGRHRRTDFALDYSDVETLLHQCKRAKKKAQTILKEFSNHDWTTTITGAPKKPEEQQDAP